MDQQTNGEQPGGVSIPTEVVMQAQQNRIAALNQEAVMLSARAMDLERQLADANGRLAEFEARQGAQVGSGRTE